MADRHLPTPENPVVIIKHFLKNPHQSGVVTKTGEKPAPEPEPSG